MVCTQEERFTNFTESRLVLLDLTLRIYTPQMLALQLLFGDFQHFVHVRRKILSRERW